MKRRLLDDNGLVIDPAVPLGRSDDPAASPEDAETTLIALMRAVLVILADCYNADNHSLRVSVD